MSFAKVYSAQTKGMNAHIIDVEVDISKNTLNAFTIVGLPDKAVEEARDRISAAIKNSGCTSPKTVNNKTVISLAPAHIKKEGPLFDLPMSLAYLLASEDISFDSKEKLFFGELSLDGELRPVKGALPLAIAARDNGFKEIFLPKENAEEAALVENISIFGANTLKEVLEHLNENGLRPELAATKKIEAQKKTDITFKKSEHKIDFTDIKGQESAKRGLEIAAAGKHNVAMYGPPGTGKTMLAKAFRHILPKMTFDEIIETTGIHSVAGVLEESLITDPPFRAPHHSSSYVSIVGGGSFPKPGEVTLAHNGVLFLDEFPEFERRVIEVLRQPLEDGNVNISRSKGTENFPADFILISAMNPCPCGNYGSEKRCICSVSSLARYKRKISGPIIDRIDIWVEVGQIDHKKLSDTSTVSENTKAIKTRVEKARKIQKERFAKYGKTPKTNSGMGVKELEKFVPLKNEVRETLNIAASGMELSPRAYHRVIKIARTIADLEGADVVEESHILEALQYRHQRKQY
jgi:magnesium chelatase family protein